jgi:quercetin dioxygenase-like cupin family protein
MEIASIFDNITYSDKQPVVSVLINSPDIKEVRIAFKAGQVMKEHKAGYPIVVAVVEGCIDFGVGEERYVLQKGMFITLEANVLHDLSATADSIVRLSLNKADTIDRAKNVIGKEL